jgi:hypothetical protein
MEGARWNVEEHCVDESLPRILSVAVPHIHLWPKVPHHARRPPYPPQSQILAKT